MSEPQHVVVDTSKLVGAVLRPASAPRQALLAAANAYKLCVNDAPLNELREVLQRPKFDRYLPLQERLDFLALVIAHSHTWDLDLETLAAASGACRDPKDDKFLALALACQAVALVSSDEDLLILDPWRGVRIVTPSAFLQISA
jgi:putative PIN family toxin of toxin-antitoxin system